MEHKIKILTDSASDIDVEFEQIYNVKVMNIEVEISGKTYRERQDFTNDEFFKMMEKDGGIPKTSQVTASEYKKAFEDIHNEGYTDIIVVTISSTGSGSYNSAIKARESFMANPENSTTRIHIIDSRNYTGAYGYPVRQAALKSYKGSTPEEILDYLNDWFETAELYFAPYSLKYVKQSGKVSKGAALIGDLLGIKPIIKIADGDVTMEDKVMGEKNIISKLVQTADKKMLPKFPYVLLYGENKDDCNELADAMTKKFGYPPEWKCQIGAAVATNSGPKMLGVVFKGKKK